MTDQEYSYLGEVQNHVFKVRRILQYCIESLLRRFEHHDNYKLKKEAIEGNPRPEYYSARYNPEVHTHTFSGMNLIDVIELVADIMSETVTKE